MSMFGNKKNAKSTFADSYGKTEPLSGMEFGGGFGATEPVPNGGMGGPVGSTIAATSGLIDIDLGASEGIESYGATVGADQITISSGETVRPVVGWLVCIKGCNFGKEFRIHSDYNYVGSQSGDIVIPGDNKMSRENHMMITYDPVDRKFYVATASGANIIRLNDKALIGGGAELKNYDVIKTGDSAFMFIGFCGEQFGWEAVSNE